MRPLAAPAPGRIFDQYSSTGQNTGQILVKNTGREDAALGLRPREGGARGLMYIYLTSTLRNGQKYR